MQFARIAAMASVIGMMGASVAAGGARATVFTDLATFKLGAAEQTGSLALKTIDFNGTSGGQDTQHNAPFQLQGVTFDDNGGVLIELSPNFSTHFAAADEYKSDYLLSQGTKTLTLTFAHAVSAVGFNYMELDGGNESWTFSNGIDSFAETSGAHAQFFGLVSNTEFTSLSISIKNSIFLTIDNLTFDDVAVPEPASLTLFGVGLIGAGLMRRRRV